MAAYPVQPTPPPPDEFGYQPNALFDWVEDLPRPRLSRAMQKEQVQQLYHAAMALPYRGEWDAVSQSYQMDPQFEGMTYGEVIIVKQIRKAAEGDQKAAENVIDRILGKPKQALETKSMHMSYSEFLDASAAEEMAYQAQYGNADQDDVIDVTASTVAGPAIWERTAGTISIKDAPDDDYDLDDLLEGV